MKLVEKVETLEVKRAFIVAQLVRKQKIKKPFLGITHLKSKKRLLDNISLEEFKKRLEKAKKEVLTMKESELDKMINYEYKKDLLLTTVVIGIEEKLLRMKLGFGDELEICP